MSQFKLLIVNVIVIIGSTYCNCYCLYCVWFWFECHFADIALQRMWLDLCIQGYKFVI